MLFRRAERLGVAGLRGGDQVAHERRRARDRAAAQAWARSLFERHDWVIVDTETTGLDGAAEVIQVGVLSPGGATVLDTLVRPTSPISWGALAVHGITEAATATAPPYSRVFPRLLEATAGKTIVGYNAAFDRRILQQTAARYGLRETGTRWECAMLQYARYTGEWDAARNDYRWQRLPPLPGSTSHSAIADCRATLAVLRRMAAW